MKRERRKGVSERARAQTGREGERRQKESCRKIEEIEGDRKGRESERAREKARKERIYCFCVCFKDK